MTVKQVRLHKCVRRNCNQLKRLDHDYWTESREKEGELWKLSTKSISKKEIHTFQHLYIQELILNIEYLQYIVEHQLFNQCIFWETFIWDNDKICESEAHNSIESVLKYHYDKYFEMGGK